MISVEAFIITNGRDTFDYALRSLKEQNKTIKITVIRDMKWVNAVNKCVKLCESQYFVRVDDDMFLHPYCVSYMYNVLTKSKKRGRTCAYSYRLWEDWQSKIAGRVKIYNTTLVKKMGGFRSNKFGKIDKTFSSTAKKMKMLIVKNDSVVGVHACAKWEDQQRYRKLWAEKNARVKLIRPLTYLKSQKSYKKDLDKQYSLITRLKKKNKRMKTRFFTFLSKQ